MRDALCTGVTASCQFAPEVGASIVFISHDPETRQCHIPSVKGPFQWHMHIWMKNQNPFNTGALRASYQGCRARYAPKIEENRKNRGAWLWLMMDWSKPGECSWKDPDGMSSNLVS